MFLGVSLHCVPYDARLARSIELEFCRRPLLRQLLLPLNFLSIPSYSFTVTLLSAAEGSFRMERVVVFGR